MEIVRQGKQKVSLARILAFSVPSLPLAAFGLPIVVQLPHHYVEYVGLSLGIVGTIFMAARLLDVFIDLGLGILMDRTNSKIGRFTPFLLGGAPLLAVFSYLLFMAKPGASPAYLALALVGSYFSFSVCMLAQLGIGNSFSSDYNERSRIFSYWQIGNIIGVLMALAMPVLVEKQGGSAGQGVQAMGLFIIITMPISALISFAFAKEAKAEQKANHADMKDLKILIGIDAFRRLLASDVFSSFSSGVIGGLFLFFLKSIKGYDEAQANIMMLIYFVVGLLCTPIWTLAANKFGKHNAYGLAAAFVIISQIFLIFMPSNSQQHDNFVISTLLIAFAGIVFAGPTLLLRAMVGDVSDEDKLKSGHDRAGLLFASTTLTSKAGYAISVGVTYIILDIIAFKTELGMNNSPIALLGLHALFIGLPIVANLVIIFLMKSYPLTRARVEAVQQELDKQS